MFTIEDLIPGVIAKMGNRTDIEAKIPVWARSAILELTQSYEFEELKVTGPTTAFSVNESEYTLNYFTNNNENWTRINSWFMVIDSSTGIGWELKGRHIMVVEPLSKIAGTPMYWAQHGRLLIVGFQPVQAYGTYMRYQRVHPFSVPVTKGDVVYMPDEWKEVVEYATAMRGASEERMFDYVTRYHDMINGDEKYKTTRGVEGHPGLIFGLTDKQERNLNNNERQLTPVVPRYGRW